MQMKFCLACNKELVGRSDKKFCDAQCRSTYHNQNRPEYEINIHNTNSIIRKNRSLLAHYCPIGKNTIRKDVLAQSGYRFDMFTNIFSFKNGAYYFCYDYGYLPINDNGVAKMVIVQKQDYMDTMNYNPWNSTKG